MLTDIQVRVLKRISPAPPDFFGEPGRDRGSALELHMGRDFFERIAGKVVVDFGCGEGADAVEMALKGARRVIGIDIREQVLESARRRAAASGVQDTCVFTTATNETADAVVSLDAFEHFADPAAILRTMSSLLAPSGEAFISFGPTWYHPLGGHLFSVFPWAHLIFSEKALITWRSGFKTDGATKFGEVAGGLNQMTIARFEALVGHSPFRFAAFDPVPIAKLRPLHNRVTREFTTAVVHCRLVRRS